MTIFADELSERDRQTVGECLLATEQGNFFPEWEFETLFGTPKKQLSAVREKWPDVNVGDPDLGAAVIGAMNHLLGCPHGQDAHWSKYITVGHVDVKRTLDKLLSLGI